MTGGGLPAADAPASAARVLRVGLVALVLLVGAASSLVAWRQGDRVERQDDEAAGQESVDLIRSIVDLAEAGLVGASAIVPADGPLATSSFEAFAVEVLATTPLEVLALADVVPAAERVAYEAILGRPIVDRGPGGPAPAPPRDVHYALRTTVPMGEVQRALIGFDLSGDPVRRAAVDQARDEGMVVFSPPVPSQPSGTTSFFVAKAMYRSGSVLDSVDARRVALAGFVTSTYTSGQLQEAIVARLPAGTGVELWDSQTLVARTRQVDDGVVRGVQVGDRAWTLVVDGPREADRGVALSLAALTVALGGGLAYLFRSGSRHDREVRRSNAMMGRTAGLAQALAGAVTVEEVEQVIGAHLPPLFDLRAASLGFVDREAGAITLRQPHPLRLVIAPRYAQVPLDSPLPMAEAVRTEAMVVLRTKAEWRRLHVPLALLADLEAAGMEGVISTPIERASGRVVAVLTLAWGGPLEPDAALLATVATVTEICQYALQRAIATDEAARRAAELALLAEHLAGAAHEEEVARVVTTFGRAPVEAAATSVGVIEGDVLRIHHGDSVPHEYRTAVVAPPLGATLAVTEVARTGTPLLFETQEDYSARFPTAGGPLLGARAVLPLKRGDGTTVGIVAHLWNGPLDLDEGLVSTLTTIAELAGQALERTKLLERFVADARRSEALAELAEVLATARTADDVAAAVADQAAGVVGAVSANVVVRDPTSGVLRAHHSTSTLDGLRRRFSDLEPKDDVPHVDVVRDGGTLTFPDRRAFGSRYPHLEPLMAEAGNEAAAVTGLRDSAGHRLGAVGFVWSHPVEFDDSLLLGLQGVAELCSHALERAQLSDAEHRLVTTLQDSVLAPLPAGPGLDCAARYLPAARSVGMGGDWYEGLVLPDGRYVVVVGDVAGHGITAVGQMAQFRAVLGALARLDTPLDRLFPLATSVVQGDAPIASAVVVVLDTAAGELRYVAAGHPPPLVRLPDGQVALLAEGRQPLLGVPTEPQPPGCHAFPPGATLVCYTDGLVERRGEPIDAAVQRLAGRLARIRTSDAEALADELLGSVDAARAHGDDIALAVITALGPGS